MGGINSQIKEKKIINEYVGSIHSLLLLKDGRLAACSSHKTVKIYDLSTFEFLFSLKGHTELVTYVCQLDNNYLVTSSHDRTLKIWFHLDNIFGMSFSIKAHKGKINKVIALTNNRIASCSEDNTIKIWQASNPYQKIKTLKGRDKGIDSIHQIKGREQLISGSYYSKNIKVWSLVSYRCETIIEDIYTFNRNSIFEDEYHRLYIGGVNEIFIMKSYNLSLIKIINNDDFSFVSSICVVNENIVLCGCEDGKMYAINPENEYSYHLLKSKAHDDEINTLITIKQNIVVSGSYDKKIKIWTIHNNNTNSSK